MDIKERNQAIIDRFHAGATKASLAAEYGLTPTRIGQIIKPKVYNVLEFRQQEVFRALDELDDEVVETTGVYGLASRTSCSVSLVRRWLAQRGWQEVGESA